MAAAAYRAAVVTPRNQAMTESIGEDIRDRLENERSALLSVAAGERSWRRALLMGYVPGRCLRISGAADDAG